MQEGQIFGLNTFLRYRWRRSSLANGPRERAPHMFAWSVRPVCQPILPVSCQPTTTRDVVFNDAAGAIGSDCCTLRAYHLGAQRPSTQFLQQEDQLRGFSVQAGFQQTSSLEMMPHSFDQRIRG